jgi:hypothetical protein
LEKSLSDADARTNRVAMLAGYDPTKEPCDLYGPCHEVYGQAVLVILALCETDHLKLISSDALLFEIDRTPDQNRQEDALAILEIAKESVELSQEIETLARNFEASGLKPLDALPLHLAFASVSKVDYFCTCDDKFLKITNNGIEVGQLILNFLPLYILCGAHQ